MIDYIQKGGLLMWPILVCSVISIAVFAERLFYFHRATIHVAEFLQGLSNLIARRNYAEALHESAGTPGPVARVIHAAIIRHEASRTELREIVQEAGQLEVPKLERYLGVLATIAFLAPLLGLLGTVAGMIDAFGTISSNGGYATVTELSSGVYKSLLT
ncbi:MAG: MotA/TolQ/ExbB proton channel family protein, partial [Chthoniobacterales bacterium]